MGVLAVETITASRIHPSSSHDQSEPYRGQRRLLFAFDFNNYIMAQEQLSRCFLLKGVKREAAAHAAPRAHGGEEADAVEAVIDGHLHALGQEHCFRAHPRKQR